MKTRVKIGAVLCVALHTTSMAQSPIVETSAVTIDSWVSTDSENTEVVKTAVNLDWVNTGDNHYKGIRLEKAWFTPLGGSTSSFQRIYARYADRDSDWAWNAQVGTDGATVIGSVNVALSDGWRKEFFIERDILETPRGVIEGIYYTFGGAALDIPLTDRDSAAVVVGAQEFTGKNVRLHVRANYVHLLNEDWGLTAQLRARHFYSTEPGEFDYFSPRWYTQVMPVLQVRRFDNGWRYLAALGYGGQRDSGSGLQSSRYLNLQVTSPANRPLQFNASLLYSNTPVSTGYVYDYLQGSASLTTRF